MKYILQKKDSTIVLYIAESHYFDIQGNRDLSLTDKKEYAERFTMEEVNNFIDKYPKEYFILEDEGDAE